MAKIGVFDIISVDGFYAGPNGEIDWFTKDKESGKFSDEQSQAAGILIFGRVTYEMMASFWPTPQAEKDTPGTAQSMRNRPKIVFSGKLEKIEDQPHWKNISIMHDINPEEIIRLKEQETHDMVILGSGSIVQQFTNLGLIDEYSLMVTPVILGAGKPLFNEVKRMNLKLFDSRSFENGNVLLKYEVADAL